MKPSSRAAATDPYVRVYYRIINDTKFEHVFMDNDALASWVRLLMAADAMYPASASLPQWLKKPWLKKLVDPGLVDLLPGGQYRIHGLDAEREQRSKVARDAAAARWGDAPSDARAMQAHSASNADASAPNMPSRDETSKDEQSRDTQNGRADESHLRPDGLPLEATKLQLLAEELTGKAFALQNLHGGIGQIAIVQLAEHGLPAVERAWRAAAVATGSKHPTIRQIVLGAGNSLDPVPGPVKQTAADEKDRNLELLREAAAEARREREKAGRAN